MKQAISLNGVIDMHVHTAPDICQRTYNDLELTAAAVHAGARAIVIKGHHCSTVARAALCNAYNRTPLKWAPRSFGCRQWTRKMTATSTAEAAVFA